MSLNTVLWAGVLLCGMFNTPPIHSSSAELVPIGI